VVDERVRERHADCARADHEVVSVQHNPHEQMLT
jgi:hypothetical protein